MAFEHGRIKTGMESILKEVQMLRIDLTKDIRQRMAVTLHLERFHSLKSWTPNFQPHVPMIKGLI